MNHYFCMVATGVQSHSKVTVRMCVGGMSYACLAVMAACLPNGYCQDCSYLSIMRKILVFAFLLTIFAFGIDIVVKKDDLPDMERLLMERLNMAPLAEYKDRDFGFVVRYPDIFVKNNDVTSRYLGCSRFDFWQLSIECYVVYDRKERGFNEYMDSIASVMKADSCRRRGNSFVVASPLYEDGMLIDGFRYYAKYVRGDNVWFVYALHYPAACTKSLGRLFYLVDRWKVWK